jgi:hypothetical protein
MRQDRAGVIAAVTTLVAVLLIAATGVTTAAWHANQPHKEDPAVMGGMVPRHPAGLDLSTVSAEIASHYRFAAGHEGTYRDVPCYCGCVSTLGHRDLLDCFVARDRSGWDPHAAGCVVCQDESQIVQRLLDRELSDGEIRSHIEEQYESPI